MAYTLKFAQLQSNTLAGAGAVIGATSLVLTSFKTIDGVNLTMTDFGSIGYGTIEPNNGTSEEQISFTGVTQNGSGTATLTGIKHVLFITPYTESSGLTKAHAGGTKFVITNTSKMYQTIIDYIDGIAIAGSPDATLTTKGIVESATTAEINAGTADGGTGADLSTRPDQLKASIYYTQLPSADQKAALAGTSGTPSVSNKYVTNDTLTTDLALKVDKTTPVSKIIVTNVTATTASAGQSATVTATGLTQTISSSIFHSNGGIRIRVSAYGSIGSSNSSGDTSLLIKLDGTQVVSCPLAPDPGNGASVAQTNCDYEFFIINNNSTSAQRIITRGIGMFANFTIKHFNYGTPSTSAITTTSDVTLTIVLYARGGSTGGSANATLTSAVVEQITL